MLLKYDISKSFCSFNLVWLIYENLAAGIIASGSRQSDDSNPSARRGSPLDAGQHAPRSSSASATGNVTNDLRASIKSPAMDASQAKPDNTIRPGPRKHGFHPYSSTGTTRPPSPIHDSRRHCDDYDDCQIRSPITASMTGWTVQKIRRFTPPATRQSEEPDSRVYIPLSVPRSFRGRFSCRAGAGTSGALSQ